VRKLFDVQLALGAIPIEKVEIPIKTRDELPPILAALQWIFTTPEVNREVFSVLESIQPADKKSTGRPGMDLWQILVLGVVRLGLDCNYDRLHYVANYDSLVRQLLGQPAFDMTLELIFPHRPQRKPPPAHRRDLMAVGWLIEHLQVS